MKRCIWSFLGVFFPWIWSQSSAIVIRTDTALFYNCSVDLINSTHVRIISNGMPDHPTFRVNPNSISSQNYSYIIPQQNATSQKTCVSVGVIGFIINGVPLYNALNAPMDGSLDAVRYEAFDNCSGHPDPTGAYHYHQIPKCIATGAADELLGISIDGFPIYGPNASDHASLLTSADLDECHGRIVNGRYRYHMTYDFPYSLGCYRGTPSANLLSSTLSGYISGLSGVSGVSGTSGPGGVSLANLGGASCSTMTGTGKLCDCIIGVVTANDVTPSTTTVSTVTVSTVTVSTVKQMKSGGLQLPCLHIFILSAIARFTICIAP